VPVTTPEPDKSQRVLPGCSGVTGHGASGTGSQPAVVRAHSRAFARSVIPGNRRCSSTMADSSPASWKAAWIAAASASVTMNITQPWNARGVAGKPGSVQFAGKRVCVCKGATGTTPSWRAQD